MIYDHFHAILFLSTNETMDVEGGWNGNVNQFADLHLLQRYHRFFLIALAWTDLPKGVSILTLKHFYFAG
jgi:hypothetical protein